MLECSIDLKYLKSYQYLLAIQARMVNRSLSKSKQPKPNWPWTFKVKCITKPFFNFFFYQLKVQVNLLNIITSKITLEDLALQAFNRSQINWIFSIIIQLNKTKNWLKGQSNSVKFITLKKTTISIKELICSVSKIVFLEDFSHNFCTKNS